MTEPTRSVSSPVLGDFLNTILETVNKTIDTAKNPANNGGDTALFEAGCQVNLAIQNAKIAYADSLSTTVDIVGSVITKQLEEIKSIVKVLQANSSTDLQTLDGRVQQWIKSLSFANTRQPHLTRVSPNVLLIDCTATEVLKFSGNFQYASDPNYAPTLTLDGRQFKLLHATPTELSFRVSSDKTALHSASYAAGTLQVPWNNNWLWPSADRRVAEYNVLLKALPLCPGKITVTYTSKKDEVTDESYTSPTVKIINKKNHCKRISKKTIWALPGCVFDPNSSKIVVTRSCGKEKVEIIDRKQNKIICQVNLNSCNGRKVGVDFHVVVNQSKIVSKTVTREQTVDLKWGDSLLLDPKPGEEVSKIAFEAFDGTSQVFSGEDSSNPYLKIVSESGKLSLKAIVPSEADLKALVLAKASSKQSEQEFEIIEAKDCKEEEKKDYTEKKGSPETSAVAGEES